MISLLIAVSFSIGFFVESIIGFGGGLIAYSILSFFVDLKQMVLAGLYIGTCASAYIAYSGLKYFDRKIFKSLIPAAAVGTIFGVSAFGLFSSEILSPILGFLLIFLALRTVIFDRLQTPRFFRKKTSPNDLPRPSKYLRNLLIFIGGLSQGAFGIGGPFVVNAIKNEFPNKSALRATMAAFFVIFNFLRVFQMSIQGNISSDFLREIFWVIIPVFAAIKLGHLVHLKISEDLFKKGIAVMTIGAAIKFIL